MASIYAVPGLLNFSLELSLDVFYPHLEKVLFLKIAFLILIFILSLLLGLLCSIRFSGANITA